MLYIEADQDASFTIPFMVDGDYVTPDVGTTKYTVYDNSGVAIPGLVDQDLTVQADATTADLTVLAANQSRNSLNTALRTIVVRYRFNGFPKTYRLSYTLIPFINCSVTEDDVRASVGLDDGEYPDSDMDIVAAYLRLGEALGGTILADAFSSGAQRAQDAHSAVLADTALASIPAIRHRASSKRAADGTVQWKAEVNFEALAHDLQAKKDTAMAVMLGTSSASPTLIVIGDRTDPLTGE